MSTIIITFQYSEKITTNIHKEKTVVLYTEKITTNIRIEKTVVLYTCTMATYLRKSNGRGLNERARKNINAQK